MLLPAFAAAGDPREDAVVTVLVDHVWIRERMERLAVGELDLAAVRELGERLNTHVRHEERVLFPADRARRSTRTRSPPSASGLPPPRRPDTRPPLSV